MMGVLDVGFWIYFLIVAVPMFVLGYITRSWVEAERRRGELERARRRHPSRQELPKHYRVVD